jgi:hypothetical protein
MPSLPLFAAGERFYGDDFSLPRPALDGAVPQESNSADLS